MPAAIIIIGLVVTFIFPVQLAVFFSLPDEVGPAYLHLLRCLMLSVCPPLKLPIPKVYHLIQPIVFSVVWLLHLMAAIAFVRLRSWGRGAVLVLSWTWIGYFLLNALLLGVNMAHDVIAHSWSESVTLLSILFVPPSLPFAVLLVALSRKPIKSCFYESLADH